MASRKRKPKKAQRVARRTKRRLSGSRLRPRAKTRVKATPKLAQKRPAARKRCPAKLLKKPPKLLKLGADPRAEAAVLEMNRGRSLTAAARDARMSPKQLQDYVSQRRLAKRKGRRWIPKDTRPRRVPVMTRGRI